MDSRIREIEQWVAEAKRGLGECGQEEYFRKLYLLDAEIRAAIKQSGILPGAASPQPRGKRVRRFWTPSLALSGALGVLVLAASTVYLFPLAALRTAPPMLAPPVRSPIATSSYDPRLDAGHIPAAITGEEILPVALLTAAADQPALEAPAASAPGAADKPAAAGKPAAALVLANAGKTKPAAGSPHPAATPASDTPGGAPAVVLLASKGANAGSTARKPNGPAGGASYSGGAFGGRDDRQGIIARFTSAYDYFPEAGADGSVQVNRTKEKTNKLAPGSKNAEITVEEPTGEEAADRSADKGADDKDKLDPEALKEKLEKRFDR